MPRYIDADKMISDTKAMGKVAESIMIDGIVKYLEEAPTADAVEVVRCKDCLYWEKGKVYEPYCNHFGNMMADTNADDFCSYGERKDGEGEYHG